MNKKNGLWGCLLLLLLFTMGCGAVEEVSNAVNYRDQALTYINETLTFGAEVQTLLSQGDLSKESKDQLVSLLQGQKQRMQTFNQIEAPTLFTSIHQQMVQLNQDRLVPPIDQTLHLIQQGEMQMAKLQQSLSSFAPLLETMKGMQEQIQKLTP